MEELFDVFNAGVIGEEPMVVDIPEQRHAVDEEETMRAARNIINGTIGVSYDQTVCTDNRFMVSKYVPAMTFPYEPYEYQKISAVVIDACYGIETTIPASNLLVRSPTGSGKTFVIRHAAIRAIGTNKRLVIGVPLVALAEQTFFNLRKLLMPLYHGAYDSPVGIRTGPSEKFVDAPILVCTFEVICIEMTLRPECLHDCPVIVLDEIHYMADRDRGSRVEAIASNLPSSTCLVGLSGTIPNAPEFSHAMSRATGNRLTRLVGLKKRPIRIRFYAHLGGKLTEICHNREGTVRQRFKKKAFDYVMRTVRERPDRLNPRQLRGRILQLFGDLEKEEKLPAMIVGFSCRMLNRIAYAIPSVDLVADSSKKSYIHHRFEEIKKCVGGEWPLFRPLCDLAKRGIGVHHSQQPKFYLELLPDLVRRGIVRAVFATSSLSVGIDLPVRTVVMLGLIQPGKNGFHVVEPNLLKQVMGRAGRPGLETEGNFVLAMWQKPDARVNIQKLLFAPSTPVKGQGMVAPREILANRLHNQTVDDLLLSPFSSADTAHVRPVLRDLDTLYDERSIEVDTGVARMEQMEMARYLAHDSVAVIGAMLRKIRKGDCLVIDPDNGTVPYRWTVTGTRPVRCREYPDTVPNEWVLDCEPCRATRGNTIDDVQRMRQLRNIITTLQTSGQTKISEDELRIYRMKMAREQLRRIVGVESHPLYATYQKYITSMESLGFIRHNVLTSKGRMVPGIIGCDDPLTLVRSWTGNVLPRDSPSAFASALSCFLQNKRHNQPPDESGVYQKLCDLQIRVDDDVSELGTNMMLPIRRWVDRKEGMIHEICEEFEYATPGHLSKTIQRLVQLLDQMMEAAHRVNDNSLVDLCDQTIRHATRGLPFLESFYLK